MSFDTDPADNRAQLDECIAEIKVLQARLKLAETALEAASELLQAAMDGAEGEAGVFVLGTDLIAKLEAWKKGRKNP